MTSKPKGDRKRWNKEYSKIGKLFVDGLITFKELVPIRERLRLECGFE